MIQSPYLSALALFVLMLLSFKLGLDVSVPCLTMQSVQVMAICPSTCECPAGHPVCPPGISTVPDGCGCCKVCAAQLNQDCSSMKPCDHHKGLECNYGNDITEAWGVCRGKGPNIYHYYYRLINYAQTVFLSCLIDALLNKSNCGCDLAYANTHR